MTLLGIGCHEWPMVLMGVGSGLAAFVIVKWAREEESPLPKWHWGDAPRRQKMDGDPFWSHAIGMLMAAFAVAYFVQNPACG